MQWTFPADPGDLSASVAKAFDLHPVAASVLVARGYRETDQVESYLRTALADLPDPFLMQGMEPAVDRLALGLARREPITLYGDYDVDGVCSTSMLLLFLKELGAEVDSYIPHRIREGYGLNRDAVRAIAQRGTRLLVALDCGISAVSEIDAAVDSGLDVVVVDHHQVGERLPRATAILNPHQPGCAYPSKVLCAAGVAFNLLMALRKRLRDRGRLEGRREPNLRNYLDLVAMATIADVVPILGVNRILVRHGLTELERAERPGVRALKEVAGLGAAAKVTPGQVAFRLGPRVNAAGRLDDASLGVQLMTAPTVEAARPLAKALDAANAERQAIERRMLDEACADARSLCPPGQPGVRGLVLARGTWHAGVVGIVASRVVERFHRPTVLIALKDGVGRGSARSVEGFHLYEALRECAGTLARFGGHQHAAGLTVTEDRVGAFRSAFERVAGERLRDDDLVPRCRVDALVKPLQLDDGLVEGLERLAPFGHANPEPVLALRCARAKPRVVGGKAEGPGHLKLRFVEAASLDAIGFGMGDRIATANGPFDAAFTVGYDEWQGLRRVQLKLRAIRDAT